MRGRQVFMESLIAHGVEYIFGNPGTTESPILDALLDYPQLRYIVALHEGVALGAASYYAQATGRPAVVTRIGGLPEVIEDGVTGFLHLLDDLDGMAASVIRLVNDDGLRRRVAQAARQSATSRFCDWRIVPAYESYYQEILARP